ncbi:MAG: hypothetical protein R2770_09195 [Acidimicrobiales bacterium]
MTDPDPDLFDRSYVDELRREAAEARTAARDLQAQVETLTTELAESRHGQMIRAIEETNQNHNGPGLHDVSDLIGRTDDLDVFRGDNGEPDPDKIRAAITELALSAPHLMRPWVPEADPPGTPGVTGPPATAENSPAVTSLGAALRDAAASMGYRSSADRHASAREHLSPYGKPTPGRSSEPATTATGPSENSSGPTRVQRSKETTNDRYI